MSPEAGRVVQLPQGYVAFVPAPLPPKLEYGPDLVLLLSKADAALSELSGIGRILPNPHLLIAPWIRREAVLSSRIEGTRASLSDLLIDEISGEHSAPKPHDDVREVRNYVSALEYGIGRLDELTLSLRLVRELHDSLGLTTVMVTHDMAEALLLADRVLVMDAGKLVADEAPRALLAGAGGAVAQRLVSVPREQAERLAAMEART